MVDEKKKTRPDWLVEMDEAAKAADDPVLDAVVKIASSVETRHDATKAVLGNHEKQLEALDEKVDATKEELKTWTEKGFETVVSKLDVLEKRGVALGRLSVGGEGESGLLDALGDNVRKMVRVAEETPEGQKGRFVDPIFRTASNEWFRLSTRLQSRRCADTREQDARALRKLNEAFDDIYGKAAYTGGTDATGGYGVPDVVSNELLRIVKDASIVFGPARKIPMTSDTLYLTNEASGLTVYWPTEGGTLTQGENTFGRNTMTALKVVTRATASSEAVEDITFGLLGYVQTLMAETLARELDAEALEGDATHFTGLISETSVNSVATTTTDGEAVSYVDLVNAMFAAEEKSTRVTAVWWMHPAIFASVVGMVDSNGQPIFQYANVPGAPYGSILGRPVMPTSALSVDITRGATGSTGNIYFGPPQKLIFGIRRGFRWDVTDQVNWATDQFDMRLMGRFGFTVATPAAFAKIVGCTQLS